MLKNVTEIEKSIKKRKKNNSSQPELTYQTRYLSHEMRITL
jgi:hypothetical protein